MRVRLAVYHTRIEVSVGTIPTAYYDTAVVVATHLQAIEAQILKLRSRHIYINIHTLLLICAYAITPENRATYLDVG
jgi:hypothetical protein